MIRRLLCVTTTNYPCSQLPLQPSITSLSGRQFGTRGSRGHGWFINYRSGRGGRHLQGEYFDRESPEQCAAWNDAILKLGSKRVYMDIVLEPRRATVALKTKIYPLPDVERLTGEKHRLTIDLASTVMAETAQNFIDLLCRKKDGIVTHGYIGSRLFRVEKNVGLKGGDVLTNTGKAGKAAYGTPMQMEIRKDPLALWHIPGTVSMLVPTVGEIDSRFLLVSHPAPHIDGICRAFGQMTPESLAIVARWQSTLITAKGIPTAYDLIIVDGGIVATSNDKNEVFSTTKPGKEATALAA
jgi:cyclophilin family peptidyl-prolyl cis-trans isomerase